MLTPYGDGLRISPPAMYKSIRRVLFADLITVAPCAGGSSAESPRTSHAFRAGGLRVFLLDTGKMYPDHSIMPIDVNVI